MIKIPYGISDFKSLRKEKYLYIDKSRYIKTLEELDSKYLFFIRPRRFGKSLFLSTLAHYYDINNKDKFDDLFENLYIGNNPTKLNTSYLVLQLNFFGLNTDNKETLELSFKERVRQTIIANLIKYKKTFTDYQEIIKNIKDLKDLSAILNVYLEKVK